MMFRSDEVRFVDLSDSLVNQAENMGIESAMNSDSYSYPPASDDFASGGDFSSGGDFASDFA
jgi:hypothetical protein